MKFSKNKDFKKRILLKKNEISNIYAKFLHTYYFNKLNHEGFLNLKRFQKLKPKNFSKTKIVRRCIITNRSRGSIRPFNISRLELKNMISFGIIPGWKKSTW